LSCIYGILGLEKKNINPCRQGAQEDTIIKLITKFTLTINVFVNKNIYDI